MSVIGFDEHRDERKTLLARVDDLEGELRVLKGMWAETIVNMSRRIDELRRADAARPYDRIPR